MKTNSFLDSGVFAWAISVPAFGSAVGCPEFPFVRSSVRPFVRSSVRPFVRLSVGPFVRSSVRPFYIENTALLILDSSRRFCLPKPAYNALSLALALTWIFFRGHRLSSPTYFPAICGYFRRLRRFHD